MNKKDLYVQKMKAQLDELQADIEQLKAKSMDAGADVKLKIDNHVKELQHKLDEGKEKLAALAKASDEAWDSITEGVEDSWQSLKKAFKEAASKFKN